MSNEQKIQEGLRGEQNALLAHPDRLLYKIGSAIRGTTFGRNAADAKPLDTRLLPDQDLELILINAKLRSLCTLRGVIHALAKEKNQESSIAQLASDFNVLMNAMDDQILNPKKLKKSLEELQEVFNAKLLHALNEAGLMEGTENRGEKKELLLLYRYLATTLDPALTVVTDNIKLPKGKVLTITSTPITQKTDEQLEKLKNSIPDHECFEIKTGEESSFYTVLNFASQKAIQAFRSEILDPTKTLPAQMRRWIPFGVKNAFVNTSSVKDEKGVEKTHTSAQSATLAFVGKGEEKNIQDPTTLNLQQLKKEISRITGISEEKLELDILILNTYIFNHENQQRMLNTTKEAAKKAREKSEAINYFNVPTNWAGSHLETVKVETLNEVLNVEKTGPRGRSNKIQRVDQAAKIALRKSKSDKTKVVVTFCASAQDRTNVVRLFTEVRWLQQTYPGLRDTPQEPDNTQKLINCLAESGHFSLMPTLLCPGSYGMKTDSIAHNYGRKLFGEATDHLHCELADTNKSAPILGDTHRKDTAEGMIILNVFILLVVLGIASVFTSGGLLAVLGAIWLGWMAVTSLSVTLSAVTLALLGAAVLAVSYFFGYQIGIISPENHLTPLQTYFLDALDRERGKRGIGGTYAGMPKSVVEPDHDLNEKEEVEMDILSDLTAKTPVIEEGLSNRVFEEKDSTKKTL